VTWDCDPTAAACSNGSTVDKFTVSLSPASSVPSPPTPVSGQTTYQMTIGGLSNGTTYTVSVAACNAVGCTPSSEIPSATAAPFGAPSTPDVVGSVSGTTINWSWGPPSNDGGRPISSYQISLDGSLVATGTQTTYSGTYGNSETHTLSVVAVNSAGAASNAGSASETTVAATQPPPSNTYSETVGGPTNTWTNYSDAGGTQGPSISTGQTVQITCKVTGFKVADGNSWWYRIASSPWSNSYYASADAFYNDGATSGSLSGTPFDDPAVPNC